MRIWAALLGLNLVAGGVLLGVPGLAAGHGFENPVGAPPVNDAPEDAPPVNAPPVDAPPVNAPPVDAPPVNVPPEDRPPVGPGDGN